MHRNEGENMTSGALFPTSPPYGVLTPEFMNSIQEELMAVIENAGLPILSKSNDTRNQILTAIQRLGQSYDYYVNSQLSFAALFERTGANAYSIKGDYDSVYFKKVVGGYSVSAILSGGDTWGDLYTNACEHLEFENGAYINFGALKGNITVNTDGCYLHNADVRGNGGSGAVVQSYLLNASRVTYDNCKCSNRLSSYVGIVSGFLGSSTTLHNITSKYINCSAYTLDRTNVNLATLYGFYNCFNLTNCLAYDLASVLGTNGNVAGFSYCDNLNSCYAYQMDDDDNNAYGFLYCNQLSACKAEDIDNIDNSGATGFMNCTQLSACIAIDIDSVHGTANGFNGCYSLSACKAENIGTVDGAANGFAICYYGSALYTEEAVNPSNDWIDTVDTNVTNKVSCPSVFT